MPEVNEMNAMDSYLECIILRSEGVEKCKVYLSNDDRNRFKRMIDDSKSMLCSDGCPTIVVLN